MYRHAGRHVCLVASRDKTPGTVFSAARPPTFSLWKRFFGVTWRSYKFESSIPPKPVRFLPGHASWLYRFLIDTLKWHLSMFTSCVPTMRCRQDCVCLCVCKSAGGRAGVCAPLCVREDYSSSVTTWREATWWERLKENLILALMWQQHFLSKCRHYLTVEPRCVHVCLARLRASTHIHTHQPPRADILQEDGVSVTRVCRLKSPASSQCRSCVLQSESPTFLRLALETKCYRGGAWDYTETVAISPPWRHTNA